MAPTLEDVKAKVDMIEINPETGSTHKDQTEEVKVNGAECKTADLETEMKTAEEPKEKNVEKEKVAAGNTKESNSTDELKAEAKKDVPVEVEPKTGVSFPIELDDRKQLNSVGLRKKSMLGMGIKIYSFGIVL